MPLSNTHWAKLNAKQVAEIYVRSHKGETARSLAAEFGVAHGAIRNVKNHRTWRDVTALIDLADHIDAEATA